MIFEFAAISIHKIANEKDCNEDGELIDKGVIDNPNMVILSSVALLSHAISYVNSEIYNSNLGYSKLSQIGKSTHFNHGGPRSGQVAKALQMCSSNTPYIKRRSILDAE
jgi:hypothetical protein